MISTLIKYSLLLLVFGFVACLLTYLAWIMESVVLFALAFGTWLAVMAQILALRFVLRLATLPLTLILFGMALASYGAAQPILTKLPEILSKSYPWLQLLLELFIALQDITPGQAIIAIVGLGFALVGAYLFNRKQETLTHYPENDRFVLTLDNSQNFTVTGRISITNVDERVDLDIVGLSINNTLALKFDSFQMSALEGRGKFISEAVSSINPKKLRPGNTVSFKLIGGGILKPLGSKGGKLIWLARFFSVFTLPIKIETSKIDESFWVQPRVIRS